MLLLLHLVALFLLVALGFYVFVADPRRRAHQTFAAFIAFLAAWTTKDIIFWHFFSQSRAAGWWVSISFVIVVLMLFSMVVFAWVFPENARTPRRRAAVLFAPAIVFIPVTAFGLLWTRAGFENGEFSIDLTPLAYALGCYVYFLFFYAAYVLSDKYRKYRGTQAGQQVGAIMLGLWITGILMTAANVILPFFGNNRLLSVSSILVVPGVLIYAYAIFNFKLFSLQSALRQFRLFPVAYKVAISIASVAILSFLFFQIPIAWWAFHNGMDAEAWRRYLVFSVISAMVPNLLLVLLVLRTISRPLQRITLAAVAVTKGAYGTEVDLRKTNDEIGLLADSFNEMSRKLAHDITELRSLNEQLIRAEKLAATGTLAAGVAHEVNNPLASISSLVQMMRERSGHDRETSESLKLIAAEIERIREVTTAMTNFARSRPAERSNIDINEIVHSSLRLASLGREFQRIETKTSLDRSIPLTLADRGQLQQVFLNILLNAQDAMPDGGQISISTRSVGNEIVIEFADTGTGIAPDVIKNIFDPFYTTKPTGEGTGLGLAVCYGIVSAHDGRIDAVPNEPNGMVFRVYLPVTR